MESAITTAAYISKLYKERFGKDIDEIKLQKLLYFTQRESYILNGSPIFVDDFVAADYGPMIIAVRKALRDGLDTLPEADFIERNKRIFDVIIKDYASISSWTLSAISHDEISWKNARDKMTNPKRYVTMAKEDIKLDAEKIRLRMERMSAS